MADSGGVSGPRDAAIMEAILKEMGVEDYDPNVVHQMLEFSYRYITNVLEDARVYSEHAQKKELDVSDVKLAVKMRMDHSFTTPPPRDFLVETAREKNSTPLPLIPEKFGPRLPPERYCLTANNYKVKERQKQPLINKPQVTLAATFRLPLNTKQQTTASSLRTQLTSPLILSTGMGIPVTSSKTPNTIKLTGSQAISLATQLQQQSSSAGLQSSNSALQQSMPTLTPMGSVASLGQLKNNPNSSSNNNIRSSSPVLTNMPTLK